jgi:hypothetical protein
MSASLGSTTYTTVTWTTGDVVTEAKLDNMVANDQAYDAHSAQGYLADNNKSFAGKNNAGSSNLNLMKLDASDDLVLGDTGVGLSATNLIADEDDMSSDSADKLATQQSIKAYVDSAVTTDGWISSSDTWTYASATSFTIASVDRTAQLAKGTKIKLTNDGGTDYYYVASSSFSTNTTVNLVANDDYALANSAITNPFYSYADDPQGFPHWFTYTPTITPNASMTYTSLSYAYNKFTINGGICTFIVRVSGTVGGTPSTYMSVTMPIAHSNSNAVGGSANVDSNNSVMGKILDSGGTTAVRVWRYDGGNWTAGTSRYIFATIQTAI